MLYRCYKTQSRRSNDKASIHISLLRTCKLIYEEAFQILYGKNVFQINCNTHGHLSIEKTDLNIITLNPKPASSIRRLHLEYPWPINARAHSETTGFLHQIKSLYPNLTTLTIRISGPETKPLGMLITIRWDWQNPPRSESAWIGILTAFDEVHWGFEDLDSVRLMIHFGYQISTSIWAEERLRSGPEFCLRVEMFG